VTKVDFQNAVWDLMDFSGENRGSPTSCVVTWLVQEAEANGPDYESSCADGTTDKIAVLLVDEGGDLKQKIAGGGLQEGRSYATASKCY
jgi:hypothetical protein